MQKKFVDELNWIDKDEMMNIISLSQSSPGAIAINASILVGYNINNTSGAFIAALATALPPLILISIVSSFYHLLQENLIAIHVMKAVRACVAAVIAGVVINMIKDLIRSKKGFYIILLIIFFCVNFFLKINIIILILSSIVIGIIYTYIQTKRLT